MKELALKEERYTNLLRSKPTEAPVQQPQIVHQAQTNHETEYLKIF